MTNTTWRIYINVARQNRNEPRHFKSFEMDVDPDEYVLDAIERIWAFQDRSLIFRHACHHSTCGACGMLVNGVEKLTCITTIKSITHNGSTIKIEPMRNFPVVSDLVVDTSRLYMNMEQTQASQVATLEETYLPHEKKLYPKDGGDFFRLIDCIECGLCLSVCPAAATSETYLGPAVLAGIHQAYLETGDPKLLDLADSENGVWRCHSAFECSAVCPSNVDPAWRIMDLRKRIIGRRLQKIFGGKEPSSK